MDIFKHTIDVLHHVIVPITQHQEAHRFQNLCSLRISFRSNAVLTTIQFDDEMGVGAKEVDNKAVDWELSFELPAAQAAITQTKPQHSFHIRLIAA